ncbi:MAG TPA: sel1 repeat family protein, partial [Rhodospirillales bacterium]|nr:sel1 repeat family protein [Rhodospirillales bacterium]
MYYGGKGVTQNYETAIKWYKLAAKQGLAKA